MNVPMTNEKLALGILFVLISLLSHAGCVKAPAKDYLSHPPVRLPPPPSSRPMGGGPSFFVDASQGNDGHAGTIKAPWLTINHALSQLNPGDTLYLRGGIYFENVYCAVAGTEKAPITIRSYPKEQAIIDGAIELFQRSPRQAWKPAPEGVPGEYISSAKFKNIRDLVGRFADSHVGLQTYWHLKDLRTDNELWSETESIDDLAVYCGPGLWYDRIEGVIHIRLAHTHLNPSPPQVVNYQGVTNPRDLLLIIAPFSSVPLLVDGAQFVNFQDLVIRGGGHDTVILQTASNITFDRVIVFAGTYGLRARSTEHLHFVNSAVYGMFAPWGWRSENGLYTYTPRYYAPFLRGAVYSGPAPDTGPQRNVSRLVTHALVVPEGSFPFEVYNTPNRNWDISYSEFTEGHDGVYLTGKNIHFHHNWVDNNNDDGIYISSPTSGLRPIDDWPTPNTAHENSGPIYNDDVHIYQNLLTRNFSMIGAHNRGVPPGRTYIYRNVFDSRQGVNFQRPTEELPQGGIYSGNVYCNHGFGEKRDEAVTWYHNTFVMAMHISNKSWQPMGRKNHQWINNLFVNAGDDGQSHFSKFGWNPSFICDYRLNENSPARMQGQKLPAYLNDPYRIPPGENPDLGAMPHRVERLRVGLEGRIPAGFVGPTKASLAESVPVGNHIPAQAGQ